VAVFACGPSVSGTPEAGDSSDEGSSGPSSEVSTNTTDATSSGTTAAPDPSGSSTGASALGCFADAAGEAVHGELLYADGSVLAVYEGCEESQFFIEHVGQEVVGPASVLDDNFVIGAYIEPCCGESGPACIRLESQAFDVSPARLVREFEDYFPQSVGDCFGIRIDLVGFDAPRCEATDPMCLPQPYCDRTFEEDCPPYDPEAERIAVGEGYSTDAPCTHDGECSYNNLECKGWMEPHQSGGILPELPLHEAFCGCVDGGCHWFEQA
jgi:hypothetical protein